MEELQEAFDAEKQALADQQIEPDIERIPINPRKSDLMVTTLALGWMPWVQRVDGRWINAARISVADA